MPPWVCFTFVDGRSQVSNDDSKGKFTLVSRRGIALYKDADQLLTKLGRSPVCRGSSDIALFLFVFVRVTKVLRYPFRLVYDSSEDFAEK